MVTPHNAAQLYEQLTVEAERREMKVWCVANGDLRLSANRKCWPVQAQRRAGDRDSGARPWATKCGGRTNTIPSKQHGFIDSQKRGIEVFRDVPPDAPLIVVEAVWQYSQHLLPGLLGHRGPILTVANWSGQWPGLVGLLNLNASLSKAGKAFDTLWSVDFTGPIFPRRVARPGCRANASCTTPHTCDRVRQSPCLPTCSELGKDLAEQLRRDKAILGVFDEGCMGMYNAIIPDELLHPMGVFKERLSQSALYAEMQRTSDAEARAVYDWLLKQRHAIQFRSRCGNRSDRGADPRAVQDVYRDAAHRR